MGMAPLAFYLRGAGIQVEAYDDRFTEPLRTRLLGEGIEVLGEPMPTGEPDCVIRSSAVSEESSQVSHWIKKGIPVLPPWRISGEVHGSQKNSCHRRKSREDDHYGDAGMGLGSGRFSMFLLDRRLLSGRIFTSWKVHPQIVGYS